MIWYVRSTPLTMTSTLHLQLLRTLHTCNNLRCVYCRPTEPFDTRWALLIPSQGPHDIPLLSHMLDTAHRLLTLRAPIPISVNGRVRPQQQVRVGFVGSVMSEWHCPAFIPYL